MAKKEIVSGVDSFRVDIADNGFILEFTGRDIDGNWDNTKLIVVDHSELTKQILKIVQELT